MADDHSLHSLVREKILEHVFVGDCLRRLWSQGSRDLEVLRADVDAGGYDVVMARDGITCQSALNFDPLSASNIDPLAF